MELCYQGDMRYLPKEFLIGLIDRYRQHPCLWKSRDKVYHEKHLRQAAYDDLVQFCKITFPEADKDFVVLKINSIKNSFRKELKRVVESMKRGDQPLYKPLLYYYNRLLFTVEQNVCVDEDIISLEEQYEDAVSNMEQQDDEEIIAIPEVSRYLKHDFVKAIIKLYRCLPCLWDTKCIDYSKKLKKEEAYKQLLALSKAYYPDATIEFVKQKISSLRSAFRKEWKKAKQYEQCAISKHDLYVPKLWYYNLLMFLIDKEISAESESNTLAANNANDYEIEKVSDDSIYSRPDFVRTFIELYRSYSCLWQKNCKDYSNKWKRKQAYQDLLAFTEPYYPNATIESVKLNIAHLRNSFIKELNAAKNYEMSATSEFDIYISKLWYFDLLMFIKDEEVIPGASASNTSATNSADNSESEEAMPRYISSLNLGFVRRLIELYQSLPCLWNTQCDDFTNLTKRKESYQQLLTLTKTYYPNATEEIMKKKITSLRRSFRKEWNKVKKSETVANSEDDIYIPKLWYYNLLMFTKDEEMTEGSVSNISSANCSYVSESEEDFTSNISSLDGNRFKVAQEAIDVTEFAPVIIDVPGYPKYLSPYFVRELIEHYRTFPCLWQKKCEDYANKCKRNQAHIQLRVLSKAYYPFATIEFVKKTITYLRNAFTEEWSRVKESEVSATSEQDIYIPKLWYYKLFSFLSEEEILESSASISTADSGNHVEDDEGTPGNTRYFNRNFIRRLIELYRCLPCLWHAKCKDYTNRDKRKAGYQQLFALTKIYYPNATETFVKNKIWSLRNSFGKEWKKVKRSEMSAHSKSDIYLPKLWYYDLLMFTKDEEIPDLPESNNSVAENVCNSESEEAPGDLRYGHYFQDTSKFIKALIEHYRHIPCLWNAKCNDFTNKLKREEAYQQLLVLTKIHYPTATMEFLKTKIATLRNSFREEWKKVKKSEMYAKTKCDLYIPKLRYYNHLLFLKDEGISGTLASNDSSASSANDSGNEEGSTSNVSSLDGNQFKITREAVDVPTFAPVKNSTSNVKSLRGDQFNAAGEAMDVTEVPPIVVDVQSLQGQNGVASTSCGIQGCTYQPVSSSMKRNFPASESNPPLYKQWPDTFTGSCRNGDRVEEYDATGITVATKLRKMNPVQAIYAESIINKILTKGLLNSLTAHTDVFENR